MAKRKGLYFYRKKKKISSTLLMEIASWIFGILAAVFIAVVANYFFGMTTEVVGESMEETLSAGQTVLVDRFRYLLSAPKRGDVVVFLPNGNDKAHYYVKRVVGLPGDQLRVESGVLYVNGLESKWVREKILDPGIISEGLTLANGEYFCIGDNPYSGEDSRSANIGPVKTDNIAGKAWFKFTHLENKMGFVK